MDFLFDWRVLSVLLLVILAPVAVVGRLLWAAIKTEKAPNYSSENFFTKPDGLVKQHGTRRHGFVHACQFHNFLQLAGTVS